MKGTSYSAMLTSQNKKTIKSACYATSVSMSAVANLSPLLFVTFREMYGISYTLLGLLVVINFATQLFIDLVFSFFAKYFNIHKTVKLTPIITIIGLIIYALMPKFFPQSAYLWICVGTVIFSVSAGLSEVLISPVIAALPSDNPEREMSKLHSIYAWGVVAVVIVSTLFLQLAGRENWCYLALLWIAVPLFAAIQFMRSALPEMSVGGAESSKNGGGKLGLIMCVVCIFLGGAAECTMGQWVSGFIESALGIPKLIGDVFGVAMFAVTLGIGRTLYANRGKNIENVMLFGMIGSGACYIIASICPLPIVSLLACVMTGLCVSMLWPGTLIYAEERIRGLGVAAYALLAAGGDMGASVVPQLVGVVADLFGTEEIGMRAGILAASVFPILGAALILYMKKYFKKRGTDCGR